MLYNLARDKLLAAPRIVNKFTFILAQAARLANLVPKTNI